MSKSTYPLKLPNSVKNAAAELAKIDGVSLNKFVAAAVARRLEHCAQPASFCSSALGPPGPRIWLNTFAARPRWIQSREMSGTKFFSASEPSREIQESPGTASRSMGYFWGYLS